MQLITFWIVSDKHYKFTEHFMIYSFQEKILGEICNYLELEL